MSQMLKSAGAMAGATLISRVLGLVREMVYSRFMGNGWVASAFIFANTVPNIFRRLLGEGALTAAFVPVFKEKEKTEGEAAMWRTANGVISGLVIAVAALMAIVILGISILLGVIEWGEQTRLMLRLLRILFPYTLLVCLAAICMGMLNARGRFFVPALGATVLNVVLIASALWGTRLVAGELPQKIYALAIGVLVAGVAQAAFQLPMLWGDGWRYRWVSPWREPAVREVVRRMIPTTLGVAAFQVNVLITQGFAFFVGESIVASFQYAVRLMELPQGLFGVSLATYLLPTLAGLASEKRFDAFRSTLLEGLSLLALVNLLAGALLLSLARPIVRLLFEGGAFRASATESVAFALLFLAPGLVAFSATNILARAFYAVGDTKVPMQISVFCLAANTLLSVALLVPLREGGLALANTLTSGTNAALLVYGLRKKFARLDFRPLWRELRLLLVAAVVAALGAYGLSSAWEAGVGSGPFWARLGGVFVPAGLGVLLYAGIVSWMRVPAWMTVLRMVRSGAAREPRPGAGPEE